MSYSQRSPTIYKCRNDGCGIDIFWKKGERQPYEKGNGQKHVCQAWIDKQNALHGTGQQVKLPVESHAKDVIMTGSAAQQQQHHLQSRSNETYFLELSQQIKESNTWLRGIMELLKEIRDNVEVNNKYTRMTWEEMKSFTEQPTTTTDPTLEPIANPLDHLDYETHKEEDVYDEIADTDDHSRDD